MRTRGIFAGRAVNFAKHQKLVLGKAGLEIGGPSALFRRGGAFPVYPLLKSLDNCDYSQMTAWQGAISATAFKFDSDKEPGQNFVLEATQLSSLESASYDCLLASHVLEHIANPLRALREWKRVLVPGGSLVVVVPDREYTFDHRRPVTTLSHLLEDDSINIQEDDQTHLAEILALHDLSRDADVLSCEQFEIRCANNLQYRCLHHHVFDSALIAQTIEYVGFSVISYERIAPHHILVVAAKRV